MPPLDSVALCVGLGGELICGHVWVYYGFIAQDSVNLLSPSGFSSRMWWLGLGVDLWVFVLVLWLFCRR